MDDIKEKEVTIDGDKYIELYLPENMPDKYYFSITTMNQNLSEHPLVSRRPHLLDFYSILWCLNGEGMHFVNSYKYKVQKGRLFFFNPQQKHLNQDKINLQGFLLNISGSFFNLLPPRLSNHIKYDIFQRRGNCVYCDTSVTAEERLMGILRSINIEQKELHYPTHWYLTASYFSQFVLYAERLCTWNQCVSAKIDCRAHQIYVDFLALVEQDFQKKKDVKWYAHELGVSTVLLSKYVKAYNPLQDKSITPLKIINNRIMQEAKNLLRHFNYNINEITERLGFSNSSNFTKFFKSQDMLHRTPSAYREAWVAKA